MTEPELNTLIGDRSNSKLLAIVSVDHADRVRCGQPTCGHSVFRRIHVVREGSKLLVLGSTCFAKRYGTDTALGSAQYGGGEGRPLTEAERQLLVNNTEALLARLKRKQLASRRLRLSRPLQRCSPDQTSPPLDLHR